MNALTECGWFCLTIGTIYNCHDKKTLALVFDIFAIIMFVAGIATK